MEIVRLLKKDKRRFAHAVGVDVSTVYRWLGGVSSPTFLEFSAIKRVTSDDANDLLNFFSDLISIEPTKSPDIGRAYIRGLRSEKMWKEAFK